MPCESPLTEKIHFQILHAYTGNVHAYTGNAHAYTGNAHAYTGNAHANTGNVRNVKWPE